jgi:hypothetical protein
MRQYFFVVTENGVRDLDRLPGCRYVEDRKDGNGPCLLFDNAVMPEDYPCKVALVTALPGGVSFQISPIVEGASLFSFVKKEGPALGITAYTSAKEFSLSQAVVADTCLYPTKAILDKDGKETSVKEKVVGGKLRLVTCFSGDDGEAMADPIALEEKA